MGKIKLKSAWHSSFDAVSVAFGMSRRSVISKIIYFIFNIIVVYNTNGTQNLINIYQGANKVFFSQSVDSLSEAAENSFEKRRTLENDMRPLCYQVFEPLPLVLEDYANNHLTYYCTSPLQAMTSKYVAYYDRFNINIRNDGLRVFGFRDNLATINKCPLVSFSKNIKTAVKYAFGITDPNYKSYNGEFPYYDVNTHRFSQNSIGAIMIAMPEKSDLESQRILHVDVDRDPYMILGRTKSRRKQDEICILAGLPQQTLTLKYNINFPDFSHEWTYYTIDQNGRQVNRDGFSKREYKARKRIVENTNDTDKERREIYEKCCGWYQKSLPILFGCENRDSNYAYRSIFQAAG